VKHATLGGNWDGWSHDEEVRVEGGQAEVEGDRNTLWVSKKGRMQEEKSPARQTRVKIVAEMKAGVEAMGCRLIYRTGTWRTWRRESYSHCGNG